MMTILFYIHSNILSASSLSFRNFSASSNFFRLKKFVQQHKIKMIPIITNVVAETAKITIHNSNFASVNYKQIKPLNIISILFYYIYLLWCFWNLIVDITVSGCLFKSLFNPRESTNP